MFNIRRHTTDQGSCPGRGLALGLAAVMPFWAGAAVLVHSLLG